MKPLINWQVLLLCFCLLAGAATLYPTFQYSYNPNTMRYDTRLSDIPFYDEAGHKVVLPTRARGFLYGSKQDSYFEWKPYPKKLFWHLDRSLAVDEYFLDMVLASIFSVAFGVLTRKRVSS